MAIIAQLSDIHITAGMTGEVDDASGPVRGLRAAVSSLLAMPVRPDCVVLTGDLADAGRPVEYQRLTTLLSPLPMPVFPLAGNHDDRATLRGCLTDLLDHPAIRDPLVPDVGGGSAEAPLQYIVDLAGVRLVCCDSTVPGEPYGRFDGHRLEWLDAVLATGPDVPTIVATHHPPYALGIRFIDDMGLREAPEFTALIRRHPQVVRVISGHVHRGSVSSLGGTVGVTCPSTYQQLFLDLSRPGRAAMTGEPPGFALHVIDGPGSGVTHFAPTGGYRPLMEVD